MGAVAGLSAQTIMLFIAVIATQVLGGAFLPRTEGFSNLSWTAACLATYLLSFWLMALMIHRGTPLSMLLPFMAAIVPLAVVAVGVVVYKEPASIQKLAWLVAACVAVGIAGLVK